MRHTTRTLTAALLAVPLVVGMVLPSSAATSVRIKQSGKIIAFAIEGPETSDTVPGNYWSGNVDVMGKDAMGYLATFECADGAIPWEDEGCDYLGDVWLEGSGLSVTTAKGKNGATKVSGVVNAYSSSYDEETGEEDYAELGELTLQATLSTYGKSIRSTESSSFNDPNTGESYRYRWSQTFKNANVTGTLDGSSIDGDGIVGSYRGMQRMNLP
ncbi:MAG: hypothetical protein Q4P07_08095 [Ornithinimicrobium sp.]|uniref:hypothetical protein n=1 Tax=Ornithinimicrobium sp. TaxID=1977084 RepID=UPI0026DFCDFD|nr:hypothetical protein [Ornithinimicrobium sp.]MDO5740095.1 hypothetical protein [Ornithinimicrobium sp.]